MDKLEFYIDGQLAEISENVDFTRIYRGSETVDLNKNNYTLTVKFPFTYNNQKLFLRANSLSYKSEFPYQTHTCIVKSNGITLIDGKIVLLSTTDAFECSIVWKPIDFIGAILNNPTKLGVFLNDFPEYDWNYSLSNMDLTYDSTKSNTSGYIEYNDGGGNLKPGTFKFWYSYPHPIINLRYLLQLVFDKFGFSLSIPTAKNNFLTSQIIRPNKEFDRYENVDFHGYINCRVDVPISLSSGYGKVSYFDEGDDPAGSDAYGNNSYYFKNIVDSTNGQDSYYLDDGLVPQYFRIQCFYNGTATFTLSQMSYDSSVPNIHIFQYIKSTNTTIQIHTVSTNTSFSVTCEDGDQFWTYGAFSVTRFKLKITPDVNTINLTPNRLAYPAKYHIPTNIDLTVGEFVIEALNFTGSDLSYDVNSDTYSFVDKQKVNLSSFDLTKYITGIKEITYDNKYIYSKLGQVNIFKYLIDTPIDADYYFSVGNTNLVLEKIFFDSKFSTSLITSGGTFDGLCEAVEHSYENAPFYLWTKFTEQPLHILWNDTANNRIVFTSDLEMSNIVTLFWQDYLDDLTNLVISGTVRAIKIYADINDVVFKRISMSSPVYIENYGKYYGVIQVEKKGNKCEFFLLELF